MNFVEKVLDKATYIGSLNMTEERKMVFDTPFRNASGRRNAKYFKEFGDMVYFMFVGGKLMKIGKAAGAGGWYSRMGMYQQGEFGDQTNKLIMRVMDEIGENKIEIYAIPSPRQSVVIICPITGEVFTEQVETANNLETKLTQSYLTESADNDLPFCVQLK